MKSLRTLAGIKNVSKDVNFAKGSECKCVLKVSLGISDTFDNACWPNITFFLKTYNFYMGLYYLLESSISDRRVVYTDANVKINGGIKRGCP